MPSLARLCTTGMSLVSSLSLLPVLLLLHAGVQGATLWEPRQQGGDPDTFGPVYRAPPPPSTAMLQALRHIQRLSQQAREDGGDVERIRTVLQQATPARAPAGAYRPRGGGREAAGRWDGQEDGGRSWMEAVLSALRQANEAAAPQEAAHAARGQSVKARHPLFSLPPPPGPAEEQERLAKAMGVNRYDRKLPPVFEDKEGQDQPLKRTNENAEEQYTPQKLATLQSVFEELSQIANSKAYNKRHNAEDDEGDDANEDYGWYREKKLAFEDGKGEEDLSPLEEQTELEEEGTRRRQFTGGLGDGVDEEDEEAFDGEGDDRDDEVKRSKQSDLLQMEKEEEPDDVTRLVDYYLFKVLEKTEQGKQRRDEEKEKEDEEEEEEESNEEQERGEEEDEQRDTERRAAQLWYGGDPKPLNQLIKISQKLKIPPEDIVDLLEGEESKNPDRLWQRTQGQTRTPSLHDPNPPGPHKEPAGMPYGRLPQTQDTSAVTGDILRILGLVNMAQPGNKSILRSNQYKPSLSYSPMERDLPEYAVSQRGRERLGPDYDDAVDENGLARYLVAELLAQRQRRTSPELELAVRDFLDDPEMSMLGKKQAEQEKADEDSDEDTLLGILQYLNLDSGDTDERDLNGKTVAGM
ncbi:secretogranin-2a [Brachyhypopomus gauderio]|uniref:secretogranin-2a n=1 Tax=Brachyhypopomus gauderio TaxID=698409 RepID=UPI004043115B